MQEYIARFGHGSAKLARQAQSKEKTLEKMVSRHNLSAQQHVHRPQKGCRSSEHGHTCQQQAFCSSGT